MRNRPRTRACARAARARKDWDKAGPWDGIEELHSLRKEQGAATAREIVCGWAPLVEEAWEQCHRHEPMFEGSVCFDWEFCPAFIARCVFPGWRNHPPRELQRRAPGYPEIVDNYVEVMVAYAREIVEMLRHSG